MAKIGCCQTSKFTIQFSYLLCSEKTRPRSSCGPRLQRAQKSLSHWQIFNEGDHRMHWWHWSGKFNNFFNTGLDFWFLTDATRWKITTFNSIHNSWPRTIPMDYITHGSTRMSGKLPTTDGRGPMEYLQCHCIHRWPPSAHPKPWRPCQSSWTSPSMPAFPQPQNKSRKMFFWQSRSFLPRIHAHSWRYQAWKK